jgi:hypothetical protein
MPWHATALSVHLSLMGFVLHRAVSVAAAQELARACNFYHAGEL